MRHRTKAAQEVFRRSALVRSIDLKRAPSFSRWSFVVGIAINQTQARLHLEKGHLLFELLRMPEIVAIQEGDILSARRFDHDVARGGYPSIGGIFDNTDPPTKRSKDGPRLIFRAVITTTISMGE